MSQSHKTPGSPTPKNPVQLSWGTPEVLYRAFREEQYAVDFLQGRNIRMRHIRYFATTPDSLTGDGEEGRALWVVEHDGQILSGGGAVLPHPVYILSLSGPAVDRERLRSRYGRHIVRINDPTRFARDLANVAGKPLVVDCVKILYASPSQIPQPRTPADRLRLTYSQKPPEFSGDEEYRIAIVDSSYGGGCLGYMVTMRSRPTYVELLGPT